MTESSGLWVIHVEDDPAIAEMYRMGLELHGFQVTVASCGDELFGAIDGRAPDAIVLDYHLPSQNGAEVLERIRQSAATSAVPVFMLSNFPSTHEGAIDRVVRAGVTAWLEKTKTPPTLLAERLQDALKRTRKSGLRLGVLDAGIQPDV